MQDGGVLRVTGHQDGLEDVPFACSALQDRGGK